MNGAKFERALEEMNYSRARLGELLNAHKRTIIRWQKDGPNNQAAMLMRMLKRGVITEEDLEAAQK